MADESGRRYGNYKFYGYRHPYSGTTKAVAFHADTNEQAGALSISADRHNEYQQQINAGNSEHDVREEDNGQQRWGRGNFEPSYPHVSWLGVASAHRNPSVLSGMMGIAQHLHGSMPYADATLSYDGSQVARHMAKRWGMRGHPDNPDMRPNWKMFNTTGTEAYIAEMTGESDNWTEDEWEAAEEDQSWRDMTPSEIKHVTDREVGGMNAMHQGVALNATGGEWPGAWMPERGDPSVGSTVRALRTLRPSKQGKKRPPQSETLF